MPKSPIPIPPKVNGRYDIKDVPLGQGGMGVVYKAYDTVTKRFVALKTMFGDADPAALELFEREWTVLARLSHPNIVDILDTGEWLDNEQRKPYFVMPLLPGATLDQLIKTSSQRLTVERTVEIMCQACRGLQAAHDQGLIHRDLKPSNIFVMDDDTVKIIDFGVVHLADTRSATGIKGTLQYMAPEQFEMKPATPLSDIFSLAVVCYEAFTGRKPFTRRTETEVVDAIRQHIPPPASEINPAVNQMISRTVHKAMAKQPWHRFSSAREFGDTLQKAMRNEPIERFDRAKIQPRIERIKKAYAEGDNQFAMEILTELESEGHIDPDMSVLRIQIVQSAQQKTIRQLLESARTRMEEEEYPLALQKISEVLNIDSENLDAQNLKKHIERQRSQHQIENWFRLVSEHRDNRHYSRARQGLQEILKLDSTNAQARQALAEIDQIEQEAAKLREEKTRLYESALASYRGGEISTALNKLERVLELNSHTATSSTPDLDAHCQSFYNQVRSERDAARNAYEEGRKNLFDGNIPRTLAICNDYLQKHPGDPMFQALKLEAEELQRQEQSAAVAEINRRAEAEPDLDKKLAIIKDAVDKYPDEPHFKSSLKLIRDRRDLVNLIVGRAKQYEERGHFNDAIGQWDILKNIYSLYPGLHLEVERLNRRKEEQLHAEAKARWMERIDSHFSTGDYGKARDVIQAALAEFAGDKELQQLQSLAEQGVKRSAEANVLLKEGQGLCAQHRYEEGLVALRKAERLDPRNSVARAALLGALVGDARALMSSNWRAAEPLVQEALEFDASDPIARSLSSIVEDYRRQEAINDILMEARNLQAAGDIANALIRVDSGLASYPNEVRLSQLHNTLQSLANESRREPTGHPPPPVPTSPSAPGTAESKPEPLATVIQPSARLEPVKPVSAAPPPAAARIPPSVKPPSGPRIPKPPSRPSSKTGRPGWLIPAAAALALLFVIGVVALFRRGTVQPTSVEVRLNSNPPDAQFSENGKVLAAVGPLALGKHSIEATRKGYLPSVQTFSLDASAATKEVKFVLTPVPTPTSTPTLTELRINSALKNGSVALDDNSPVDLQDGSFAQGSIARGNHSVRIFDGKREILSFSFDARPNEIASLTTPLATKGSGGFVVSSLDGSAKLYATPGMRGGAVGEPPLPIPSAGIPIPGNAQNPAHFIVDDGKGKRSDQLADASHLPVMTVQLAGADERIQVAIDANVPDGAVMIGGRLRGRLIDGSRTVPLRPGTYAIKVTHDGYQDSDEQKIMIKAGDAPQKLDFVLNPILRFATLSINSAPPDAGVFLDSVRIGTINPGGTFLKDNVSPGSHLLQIRGVGFVEFKETRDFKAGETAKIATEMNRAMGMLAIKVMPASANITVHRAGETESSTVPNGQPSSFAIGSYVVSAEAQDHKPRSDTFEIEAGKTVPVEWTLERDGKVQPTDMERLFENGASWRVENRWWSHPGVGFSFLRDTTGTYGFDFLDQKTGGLFGGKHKKIVFVADFKDPKNYISYTIDGHNLTKKIVADGSGGSGSDAKVPHGMEGNSSYHLVVEMTPDLITIKNRAGKVLDSQKRSGSPGKLGIQDGVVIAKPSH